MTPRPPGPQGSASSTSRRISHALVAWIRFIRRHSIAVLALALVSAIAAGAYAVTHARINTSTTDMLSDDLPFQQQFEALDHAFPQDYRTVVVVVDAETPEQAKAAADQLSTELARHPEVIRSVFYPEGDPFFRRNGLLYLDVPELQTLGTMLAGAQPLLSALAADPSLRGLAEVLKLALDNIDQIGGGTLPPQFEAALSGIASTVTAVEGGKAKSFSWRGTLAEDTDPKFAGKRQLLLLEPVFDFSSLQPAQRAVTLIRSTAAALNLDPQHGVRVRLTGEPVMVEEELKSVEDSIGLANLLSIMIVVALLVVALRSGRLVEATTFSLLVGLAWTACFAVAAVGTLNLISVAFAVLFIGFGVDFGIHFSLRAKEYIDAEMGPALALEEAGAGVAPGLTLTSISASIGFLAFGPTAYQGLVELGIISAAGMVVALFTSLTLVPAYLEVRTPRRSNIYRQRAANLALDGFLHRSARPILWGALALGIASATALPFARFDDSPLNLRDPQTESISTLYDLLEDRRFDPFRAAVLAKDAGEADRIAARLRQLPEVRAVETVNDLVPADQDEKLAMLGDLALMLSPVVAPDKPKPQPQPTELRNAIDRLRESVAAVADRSPAAKQLAETLSRFDASDANLAALQRALLANLPPMLADLAESLEAQPVTLADVPPTLIARRQTATGQVLVEVFPKADLRDQASRRAFADAVQAAVPEASGEAVALTEAGRAVIRSFFQAGAFTFALIAVLLLVVLRNLRDSAMVMAPLLLAGMMTVATTVLIDVPFNFANVIVLPLLFGLGVSSGINMAVRGRQQGSRSLLVTSTPRAVLFSALTTIGSFGSLAISKHPGMASMGLLLTVALIYSTLCTLTVLPALRDVFGIDAPHRRHQPRRADAEADAEAGD